MTTLIVWAGVVSIALMVSWAGVYIWAWHIVLRKQVTALQQKHPGGLSTSAQSALVTQWSLNRIGRHEGRRVPRTGKCYSILATQGSLQIVKGPRAEVLAAFPSDQIVDVRVGTTSVLLADYTTLFFGIRTGGTTFELPIRVNGPKPTSVFTAPKVWAAARGDEILRIVLS